MNQGDPSVETIILTINDYFEKDFVHLSDCSALEEQARIFMATNYLRALIFRLNIISLMLT